MNAIGEAVPKLTDVPKLRYTNSNRVDLTVINSFNLDLL